MTINKEGFLIIAISAVLALAVSWISALFLPVWAAVVITFLMVCQMIFVVAFFREPSRGLLEDDSIVYSPADGKVVAIEQTFEKEYLKQDRIQVSVFMSVVSVHVNWFPVSGNILYFKHHRGKFMVAWHPKSSEENERTTTVVDNGRHKILFRQIAGFVARRIVSYAEEGVTVKQNSKCGFIKFGSRMDIMLPLDSEILVSIGDKVTGSQTPLAKLS